MDGTNVYEDHQGRRVIVSTGLSVNTWGAYRVKPSGLRERIKAIPYSQVKKKVKMELQAYAQKKGWRKF